MFKFLNTPKFIILLTVFVDILGLGIIIPVLPFYVKSFGVSDFVVTLLFTVFSLFSFVSAPFLGALSDKIGRRPILIVSITSTAIGWLIFAAAKTVPFLFLGRIIDGLAAGNISTAQSYLIDMSDSDKNRTANLGLIGAMFGIGLTVGPLIGGVLGSISHTLPFWAVGALAAVNAILAYFRLPETHHNRDTDKPIEINPLKPIYRALRDKILLPGFIAWFLFGLAVACQQSIFSLFLSRTFGYNELVAGFFLTGVGIVLSINQGFLLKRFWIKKFKEPDLELYLMLIFAAGFFLMDAKILAIFIFGLVLFTLGHSVLRVVMTSQMAGMGKERQGEVLGTMSSVMSISMILGPLLGGFLFIHNPFWPFLASGAIALITFAIVLYNRKRLTIMEDEPDAPTNFAI